MANSPTNINVHFCRNRLTNTAKIFEAFANRTFLGGAQSPFFGENRALAWTYSSNSFAGADWTLGTGPGGRPS